VGYEYKRFRSISSNCVRHGKCLVMSRILPTQARHKHWFQCPVLSQSTHQEAARVNPAPTNHGLPVTQQPSIFRESKLTPCSLNIHTEHHYHAMSEKKGNHIIGNEALYNPLNPPNRALTIERKKKARETTRSNAYTEGKKKRGENKINKTEVGKTGRNV